MMGHITDPEVRERVRRAQGWLADQYSALGGWKAVAKLVAGKSESAIVGFAHGSYTGNPVHILGAVEKAMIDGEEDVFTSALVETAIARRLRRAVRLTRVRKALGMVAGQSGCGKSTILRHIAAADKDRIVYYPANESALDRSWGTIGSIVKYCGLGDANGMSHNHRYERLVEFLQKTRKGLIVDNAEFCSRSLLQTLRTIAEEGETWILFAGNERIAEFGTLDGENPAAFTQFVSRCSVQETIILSAKTIPEQDVDLIARQLLPEAVLDATLQDLHAQTLAAGGFRRLRDILQESLERSGGRRDRITEKHVYASIEAIARKRGGL